MRPGLPLLGLDNFYLYIFVIAVFVMGILGLFLGVFKSSLLNRLSTRIAILMLASGPITLVLIPIANRLILGFGARAALIVYVLIALIVPVLLGLLAAHFVRRPLRQFNDTVASLKQNNYEIELSPSGVGEFDEVFSEFNDLIRRLRHEEKLRKDLISDTSHELNTPLTTMIGQLTAIQEGKYAPTEERIALLKEQTERLVELVQQLDAYTKARSLDARGPEDIQLKQFCQRLMRHSNIELRQKDIRVKLNIPDDLVLRANRDALQRIITNLMQNTLRYSEATELVITATAEQLVFSDNGKGVPPQSLPYLFERFYRVEKSRSRATGGLGLGLAIVSELVERQGWHIHAKAAHPGLSFVIEFN